MTNETGDNPNRESEHQKQWRPATQLVRGGLQRSQFEETAEAIYMTSGYVYKTAQEAQAAFKGEVDRFVYSRYGNPTVQMFQDRMRLLEGADFCFASASGMAAVFAALASQLRAGDRVVASRALFGSCFYIICTQLPMFGIETVLVDGTDLDAWERELSAKPTQAVFLETPSNPNLEVLDLSAISEIAHNHGAKVLVDNVFATPILQKPLELGADIVIYSATKHIDGQGRAMGGAILTNDEAFFLDHLTPFMRNTGPAISPFNAWVLLKGLETFELRVRQQCENANRIAEFLEARADIKCVLYPGLESHPQHALASKQMKAGGTLVAFEFGNSFDDAFRVLNALELIDISNNLGDVKSLITHPPTTTHQKLTPEQRAAVGIPDGMIRLSVGLEDPEDLMADLDQAFKAAS